MLKLQHFCHPMGRANSLERLKAGGEGDDRRWDGWVASPAQWTWVWANSGRQWRTGKPGVLQSMELQRVGYDLVTEEQQNKHLCKTQWEPGERVFNPDWESQGRSHKRGKTYTKFWRKKINFASIEAGREEWSRQWGNTYRDTEVCYKPLHPNESNFRCKNFWFKSILKIIFNNTKGYFYS